MEGCELHVIRVENAGDPRLEPYLNQKDAWLRAAHNPARAPTGDAGGETGGRFIAEGELVVEALARSRFAMESVLTTDKRLEALRSRLAGAQVACPVYVVLQEVMDRIAGFHVHRGVLACGLRGKGLEPREVIDAADVIVVMENLANHDNVGGMFRCVAALGGGRAGVLYTQGTCDPLYRKAIRVSMGHVLRVPFARVEWPGEWPERLKSAGFEILALTPDAEAEDIGAVRLTARRFVLVVGAERPGLTEDSKRAGRKVKIPMAEGVDSLNVTVAAAIALYQIPRL